MKRVVFCFLNGDLNVEWPYSTLWCTLGNEAEWVAFVLYVNLLQLVAFWIRFDSCLVIRYFEYLLSNLAEYIIY